MSKTRRLSVALTVAGVLGVAAPAAANATALITISGATSSYPLVSLLAAKYVKLHPGKVRFKIAQGGTAVGISDVKAGHVTIADVAQEPNSSDAAGLGFNPIAKYAICVVTNKSNTRQQPHAGRRPRRSSPARRRPGAASPARPRPARST